MSSSGHFPRKPVRKLARNEATAYRRRLFLEPLEKREVLTVVYPSADTYYVNEDSTLSTDALGGVLANDGQESLTASLVSGPMNGMLSLSSDGSFSYSPVTDFWGTDSFTYEASDGVNSPVSSQVTIHVQPMNDPPTVDSFSLSFWLDEDSSYSMGSPGLLNFANDIDGDTLTASIDPGMSGNGLTVNGDGSFEYTPAPNFHGSASFSFLVSDGQASVSGSISFTVYPINDPPIAADHTYEALEDTPLSVGPYGTTYGSLLDGVIDPDEGAQSFSAMLQSGPYNGSVVVDPSGSFVYTPGAEFSGTDTFTYQLSDGLPSNTATVTINVSAINDAPVAFADAFTLEEDDDDFSASLTMSDIDSSNLTAVLATGVSHGVLIIFADGTFTYVPALNYFGDDSFSFYASDGSSCSSTVSVNLTITPVNDAPVAVADEYTLDEDTALTVPAYEGVLSNDSDIEGDTLTAIIVTPPLHGTVNLGPNGEFSYVSAENYNGPDSFTYSVSDGYEVDDTVVSLAVNPVDEVVTIYENEVEVTMVAVSAIVGGADAAHFIIHSSTGQLTFQNPPDYEDPADENADNSYEVVAVISDGANSDSQLLTVTVLNVDEPVTITSDGGGDIAYLLAEANQSGVTTVEATDDDVNATITFALVGGADASDFSIDPDTGELAFVNAPLVNTPTDANTDNVYEVIVAALSGSLSDTQTLFVTVNGADSMPTIDNLTDDPIEPDATVKLSEKEGFEVFDVQATDHTMPEPLRLTYSLGSTGGGLFKIDPDDGKITLARDIPLASAQPTYVLDVNVTNTAMKTETDKIKITFQMVVGIFGDTMAVEGATDRIELTIRRYALASDLGPLDVYYELNFDPIENGAFGNVPTGRAAINDFTVTSLQFFLNDTDGLGRLSFNTNEEIKKLPVLEAKVDVDDLSGNNLIAIENCLVRIVPDSSYGIVDSASNEPVKNSTVTRDKQELLIVDKVQLYSPNNPVPALSDLLHPEAFIPAQQTWNSNNPGIHPNDVMQGDLNDCYAVAAIRLLAQIDFTKLQHLIADQGNGSYKVFLWEGGKWKAETYTLANALTAGANGTQLSGDADAGGVEIWVNLLIRRLSDGLANRGLTLETGDVPICWALLTGEEHNPVNQDFNRIVKVDLLKSGIILITDDIIHADLKDQIVFNRIQEANTSGKFVIVGTRNTIRYDDAPANDKDPPDGVYGNHAYILDGIITEGGDGLKLTNPHGRRHVNPLQKQYLFDYLVEWYELKRPNTPAPPAS